jgi:hypothetical protein
MNFANIKVKIMGKIVGFYGKVSMLCEVWSRLALTYEFGHLQDSNVPERVRECAITDICCDGERRKVEWQKRQKDAHNGFSPSQGSCRSCLASVMGCFCGNNRNFGSDALLQGGFFVRLSIWVLSDISSWRHDMRASEW